MANEDGLWLNLSVTKNLFIVKLGMVYDKNVGEIFWLHHGAQK